MSNIPLPLCICVTLVSLYYTNVYSLQVVCEEISRLAPKAGLHHDGVVFGSDDFCASIGSYYTFCLTFSLSSMCFSFFLLSGFLAKKTPG